MIILIEKFLNKMYIIFKLMYWKLKYKKNIQLGRRISFRRGFKIRIENGGFLKIGDNCFFNNECSITCLKRIEIGLDNIFGEGVKIYDHDHKFSLNGIEKFDYNTGEISIGNNNWICSNVVLLRKTNIRDNNVIGAGVILNSKIDSNKLVTCESRSLKVIDIKERE